MDRRLQQFLAVAETGNLTQAAEVLRISQPTLTVNIRKLEEEHGVTFFERSSRGMTLTEYGAILYDHASTMARLADHAKAEIAARRAGRETALRIGCGYVWWDLFVRDLVLDQWRAARRREVHVEVGNSFDGVNAVLAGDAAVFVGHEVPHLSAAVGVRFLPLFEAEDACFARDGHPLVGSPCSVTDVERYDLANTVPVEPRHRRLLDHFASARLRTPLPKDGRRILSSPSLSVCADLMRASDAVLLYPRLAEDMLKGHGLVRLDLRDPIGANPVGIYLLEERWRDRKLRMLCAEIGDAARDCGLLVPGAQNEMPEVSPGTSST